MHYSIQPRDRIFVKDYGCLSLAKSMSKIIGKKLNGKYSWKLLDHAKQSATDALKNCFKKSYSKNSRNNR